MDPRLVSANIKPAVHVKCGDQKVSFHSGCSYIDVTFPGIFYVEIAEICFKNFYTHTLTVRAKKKSNPGESEPKFCTCVRDFQLMPCAHADPGAEDWFTINQKHMLFSLQNIIELRFILRQPSPIWKDFKIDNIRFYKAPSCAPVDVALPKWVTENTEETERTLKQVPSIPMLSKDLQQLWALTSQAASQQSNALVGRYDIDGNYEINLLSYN